MAWENDYYMRLNHETIKTILSLLGENGDHPTTDMVGDPNGRKDAIRILKEATEGQVCEAENHLYDLIENQDPKALKIGLLLYDYLNEQTEEFLEEHDFSHDEVKDGIKNLASRYGFGALTETMQ